MAASRLKPTAQFGARAGLLAYRTRRCSHTGVCAVRDEGDRQGSAARRRWPALGYEMVLGNTFHLLLSPGPD